jgi:hypothetical protein
MRGQSTDPYNRRLSDSFFKFLGKSALIVAGLGYGLFRGLRAVAGPEDPSAGLQMEELAARLQQIERAVGEMSKRDAVHDFVTHEELAAAIDRATARIGGDLDRKFQAQSNAVNSLRAMISQTDILLQRVLEGIENSESEVRLAEGSRR